MCGGEEEGGGVRSWPGAARTILIFHIISARPSKQPLMVRTFPKVYVELVVVHPRQSACSLVHGLRQPPAQWCLPHVDMPDTASQDGDDRQQSGHIARRRDLSGVRKVRGPSPIEGLESRTMCFVSLYIPDRVRVL
jgi:hypothetical protein